MRDNGGVLVRKRKIRRDRQVSLLPPNREVLASGGDRVFFITSKEDYSKIKVKMEM